MFVKTQRMLELDMLTLSLSLKQVCVEMQKLILANVFFFSPASCVNTETNRKHYLTCHIWFFHDVRHFDPLWCVYLCWRRQRQGKGEGNLDLAQ